jgi:predicted RNA binding protein YcfA (HicA-like mRNA interferase family)
MTRLPTLTGIRVIRALERAGFVVVRIKGSHHMLAHTADPKRRTTVPLHKGQDLPRGLLHKILADTGLTVEQFLRLL